MRNTQKTIHSNKISNLPDYMALARKRNSEVLISELDKN